MSPLSPRMKVMAERRERANIPAYGHDLEEATFILREAQAAFDIWWLRISKDGVEEYGQKYATYPEFFESLAYMALNTFLINLYKISESNTKTVNFQQLVQVAYDSGVISQAAQHVLDSERRKVEDLWKKVTVLRHNLIAHRRKGLSRKEIYEKAKLKADDLRTLMNTNMVVLNLLRKYLNKEREPFGSSCVEQFKHILARV